ncbi:hypothetical protein J8J14_19000 [Roseomonas sp. SSH11]|uniref:AsmA-like C-terminal domain-containing protein n=1 Tax=Pararoseomonas baculiformis TaxID=2820812 RepID=A0ABS4AIK3_9PROT|nr:hypothetical protein [Pararoseomonas baculiformis]MBP0446867.1 hypothetical protein [Pararoseomonas baculiformis]
MRRRHLLLAGCLALPVALGAYAQAEAERQLDAAIERLRAGLGPDGAVEWRSRSVDPATGTARLQGLTIRQGKDRLTAAEVVLDGLQADRLGRAVLTDLRMEEAKRADAPAPMVIAAGRVSFVNLVLPAAGAGPGVDWSALAAGEALAEGIRVENPGRGEAELARLSLAGYAPGRVQDAVLEGFRFTDRSDGEVSIRLGRAQLAGAVVPRIGADRDPWALAADSARIEGAELVVQSQQVSMRLGRMQLDGWGEGRLTSFALEGLKVEGETKEAGPFVAELGRAGLSGFPARDTAYAIAHDLNPPQPIPGQDQDGMLEGLAVSTAGAPLLRIATVRARNSWDATAPRTQTGTLAVEGVALDLPPEQGGDWLDGLGFKRILARLGMESRFLQDQGRILADPFLLQAAGMGSLGISLDLGGIQMPTPGQPSVAKEDPLALIANWTIGGLSIRYTEEGLLRALLAQQAARERVPESQLRARYAQMVQRFPVPGVAQGKEAPQIRAIREALASFARDLGTIEIAMRPAKPVPMPAFMTLAGQPPEQLVRELGLTARATPPAR